MSNAGAVIELDLPWPPTVNHYWIATRTRGRNSRALSRKAQAFRFQGALMIRDQVGRAEKIDGPVSITLHAHVPDRRKRDLDNIWKGVLDLLSHCGIIEDDCQVYEQHGFKRPPVKGGRCFVTIQSIAEGAI